MIAPLISNSLDCPTKYVHEKFLELLPKIRRQAAFAFRGLRAAARDELTQEVLANAYCALVQLVSQGKAALAYPTPLAQYALRQSAPDGRSVAG